MCFQNTIKTPSPTKKNKLFHRRTSVLFSSCDCFVMPGRKNAPRQDGHGPPYPSLGGLSPVNAQLYSNGTPFPVGYMDANSGLYKIYNGDEQTVYWGEKISLTTNGTPLTVVLYQLIRRSSDRNSKKDFSNFLSTGKLLESSIMISESSLSHSGRFKTDFSGLCKQAIPKKFKATSSCFYFAHS